jgi:hypothetical protein
MAIVVLACISLCVLALVLAYVFAQAVIPFLTLTP